MGKKLDIVKNMWKSIFNIYICLLLLVSSIWIYSYELVLETSNLTDICIISSFAMMIANWTISRSSDRGIWSIPSVYAIVFSLFHFGIITMIGFGSNAHRKWESYLNEWIFSNSFKMATILVTIGLLSFAFGVHIAKSFKQLKEFDGESCNLDIDYDHSKIGFSLVSISIFYWVFVIFKAGGLTLFGDSYSAFRIATSGAPLKWAYYFMSLGLFILVGSRPSMVRRFGMSLFVIFAILALPLGLRGEVMFPVFTCLAISSMKKIPFSYKTVLVVGLCSLVLISVIKQVRQVGIAKSQISEISLDPSDGLMELGGSLRPVVEVVNWIKKGDNFILGASYWAPIDRVLVYIIPGWTRPPANEDQRILGNIVNERSGSIGFSVIAEAYYNFGTFGVISFMFLVGFILGRIDMWNPTYINQLKAGIVLIPFMIEIRNTFIFVPVSLAIGYIFVWFFQRKGHVSSKIACLETKSRFNN